MLVGTYYQAVVGLHWYSKTCWKEPCLKEKLRQAHFSLNYLLLEQSYPGH